MADRLTEISNNFAENRDVFYRERLRSFQADITYINNAQLYDNKPLDDLLINPAADQNAETSAVQPNARTQFNVTARAQPTPGLGEHAAKFVQDVNDTLEERDAELTRLAVSRFN